MFKAIKETIFSLACLVTILFPIGSLAIESKDAEFVFVHSGTFKPFVWAENGISQGLYVDVINEAFLRMEGKLTPKFEVYPWARAQRLVELGEKDALITVPTAKRLTYTDPIETPIVKSYMGVFTNKDNPKLKQIESIRKIEDIKPYSIISYIGNGWAQTHLKDYKLRNTAKTASKSFLMLSKDRGDIVINAATNALYLINSEPSLSSSLVWVKDAKLGDVVYVPLISKLSKHKDINERLNNAIVSMYKDGTIGKIYEKHGFCSENFSALECPK